MSMSYLSYFAQNMISGRGFIGISIAFLANGQAFGSLIAALGFGAANALSITSSSLNLRPTLKWVLTSQRYWTDYPLNK